MTTAIRIDTSARRAQWLEDGYFVLPGVIPPEHLALLREQCRRFIDLKIAEMDARGTDVIRTSHRGKRYVMTNCFRKEPRLRSVLFDDLMAQICRATIGDTAYLYWEQYVVKGPERGMKISWHQDSGYNNYFGGALDHRPYVTCWCALDDMSEENGSIRLIPASRLGIRSAVVHVKDEATNEVVGYFGKDPGDLIEIPAGSIAVFSSLLFHRSGPNLSQADRRVYLAQYSPEPIVTADRAKLYGNAEPFLRDGRAVVGEAPPPIPSRLDDASAW